MAIRRNSPPRKKAAKARTAVKRQVVGETTPATNEKAFTAATKKAVVKKAVTKKTVTKKIEAKKAATTEQPAVAKQAVAKKAASPARKSTEETVQSAISHDDRREMVATMAYYLAEKHGFQPGSDERDWLECERMVNEILAKKGIVTKG